MTAKTFFIPFETVLNTNGLAIPNAVAKFFSPGTLTPKQVFANSSLTTAYGSSVTADGAGRFPSVYMDDSQKYRVQIYDNANQLLTDVDDYVPGTLAGYPDIQAAVVATQTASAAAVAAAAEIGPVGDIANSRVLQRLAVLEDKVKDILPSLTTGGAAYHAVYSTTRLIPSYSGPAFRAVKASDSSTVEVNFTGKTVTPGDIRAINGAGVPVRIDKWYDQSGGGGGDMTQTVSARRPGVRDDVYLNGAPVIFIDGGANFIGGPARGFDMTHAITGHDCTLFFVTDYKASSQLQTLVAYEGSSGVSGGRFLRHEYSNTANGLSNAIAEYDPSNTNYWSGKFFRAAPTVLAFREKAASAPAMFVDGTATSALASDLASPGANTTETLTTGFLGYSAALPDYDSNMRILAYVVVNGALNDADVLSVTRALQSNFSVPSRFDSRVVFLGDSIDEGCGATNTLELMWYLRQQTLTGLPEFYNLSIAGNTLVNSYSNRAFYDALVYRSGEPIVFVIQLGTNDIHANGTSGSALYTALTTYVAYLKALGSNVKVVVNTLLKRTDNSTGQADEVIAYNTLVRANTAGADVINDVAAEAHFAATGSESDTTLLVDGIHPTSLGCKYLAPVYATAINSVLS